MIPLDLIMTAAQGVMTLFLLPTAVKRSYVPRVTSSVNAVGLFVIAYVLIQSGLPLGGTIAALCGVLWVFIFLFRGRPL